MNPSMQDDAALFALGLMDPEESRAFEQHLRADPELARLVDELRESAAELAHGVPAVTPSPSVKARLMAQVASERNTPALRMPSKSAGVPKFGAWNALGWGLAAVLAITSTFLALAFRSARHETTGLQRQLEASYEGSDKLTSELAALREQNALSHMEIAMLQSSLEGYKQGVAVVVWDGEKGEGILKLEKMPPLDTQKDYQLWVVDTKNPVPVNAGVVKVDQNGYARVGFKPMQEVTEASKFALSVERKGGVPRGEGPIVFISP